MLKQKYFLTGIFILSAERQPIKLAWRKIVWLRKNVSNEVMYKPEVFSYCKKNLNNTELYDLSRILSISLDYVKNPAKKNMFVCER